MNSGSRCFPAISDPTDVGLSRALPRAFAFSVFPMRFLLTRLAVRSARSRGRARLTAFPCSTTFTRDDLGPLSTPAVRPSRRAIKENPNLTAYLFDLVSRNDGRIPVLGAFPTCDIGQFPSLYRCESHRIVWSPLGFRSEEHTSELQSL